MADDNVAATDQTVVGLAPAVPARHPCERCGRETKEHTKDEEGRPRRICAMPLCRHVRLA